MRIYINLDRDGKGRPMTFVIAGHSRPKDGVASARLWPGHPRLLAATPSRRGCPAQGRAWRPRL